jgi:hypothetical protein
MYAARRIRWGFGTVYITVLALATACLCFSGAIWRSVEDEKQKPCELVVTAPSYLELNEQTVQDILNISDVLDASGCIDVAVTVTSGNYTASFTLIGIDGAYLTATYTQGSPFPEESVMPWMVLTEAAAKSFSDPNKSTQKKSDEMPDLDWLNADFILQAGDITVVSKVRGLTDDETVAGYISQTVAKSLLQRQGQPGGYNSVMVRIRNIGAAEAVAKKIADMGYFVENMDTARQEKWDNQLREAVYLLLLSAVACACARLVKKIDYLKRQAQDSQETEALAWMGMSRYQMQTLAFVGSLQLSILGTTVGVFLSYLVAWLIPTELRDVSNFALTLPWPLVLGVFVVGIECGI